MMYKKIVYNVLYTGHCTLYCTLNDPKALFITIFIAMMGVVVVVVLWWWW